MTGPTWFDPNGDPEKPVPILIPRIVSPAKARHVITRSVLDHLREAGIQLAYPHRDVRQAAAGGGDGSEPRA